MYLPLEYYICQAKLIKEKKLGLNNKDNIIKELLSFVNDVAHNFDCDEDGHKYQTGCRACNANELLMKYEKFIN